VNVRAKNDITAAPAVAAVGSASGDKRLVTKRGRPFAAVSAANDDAGGIDEMSAVSLTRQTS